jgi:hypothetical protein
MKKKILLLVVFMMIGAIAVVAQEQPDRLREKAGEQRTVSVTAQAVLNETRLQACREFLQGKDSNPNATCVGLLTRQINCYEYMKGKGIADPFTACNNLFRGAWSVTKERAFLARAVSVEATEVRLKNLDRLVEKHPNAAGFIKNLTAQEAQKFLYLPGGMQQRILGLNHTQIENALAKLNVTADTKQGLLSSTC